MNGANVYRERVIVPPTEVIRAMSDEELADFRERLIDASDAVDEQIAAAWATGQPDNSWLIRTQSARSHFRRGLATVKAEQQERGLIPADPKFAPDVQDAFAAIDQIKRVLVWSQKARKAIAAFVQEDSDDNFAALEQLIEGNDNE